MPVVRVLPLRPATRRTARAEMPATAPAPVRTVFPPQWSKCRWLLTTMSIDSGSIPCAATMPGQRLVLRRHRHPLARSGVELVARAGLDQDGVFAGADDVAVERDLDAVQLVGRRFPAPQRLRHDSEKRAAVPAVPRCLDMCDFEIADDHPAGTSPSPACVHARRDRLRLRPVAGRARTFPCWLRRSSCRYRRASLCLLSRDVLAGVLPALRRIQHGNRYADRSRR